MATNSTVPTLAARIISPLFILLMIGVLILGSALFISFLLPYPQAAGLVNRLASDGQLESFTLLRYQQWRISALFISTLLVLLAFSTLFFWQRIITKIYFSIKALLTLPVRFGHDWVELIHALRQFCDRRMVFALLFVTALAIVLRIFLIMRPMQHDEAYTAVVFGFEPLRNGLSDYHVPNNHVFHTLLVHIAYRLFGAHEWAVRLPAFLSGVLLAPLGVILTRHWYARRSAWLAGVMIASMPALIDYSVNARGYTLMAFFTLLIFILGTYLQRHHNLAAWFLLILCGALGFYTLPIMVYPLVILYLWMGLAWLVKDHSSDYPQTKFLKSAFVSGLLTIITGLAFYLPIFRNWGLKSLLANPYVEALSSATYNQTLLSRLQDFWAMINSNPLPFTGILLLIGFVVSLIFQRQITTQKIPLQLLSLLTISILVGIQRPNIFARTWVFYLPLLCIWAAAGLLAPIEQLMSAKQNSSKKVLTSILLVFWSSYFLTGGLLHTITSYPTSKPYAGEVEQATLFLKQHIQPADIVVITAIDDTPMWFYFAKYDLARTYFERARPFESAYVVVNPSSKQTVNSVISDRGPDSGFFDYSTQRQLISYGHQQIYMIAADREALEKAYDQKISP